MSTNDWQLDTWGSGAYVFRNACRDEHRENVLLRVRTSDIGDPALAAEICDGMLQFQAVIGTERVLLGVDNELAFLFVHRQWQSLGQYEQGDPEPISGARAYAGTIDGHRFGIHPFAEDEIWGIRVELHEPDGTRWSAICGYQARSMTHAGHDWPQTEAALWQPPAVPQGFYDRPVVIVEPKPAPAPYQFRLAGPGEVFDCRSEDELYAWVRANAAEADEHGDDYEGLEALRFDQDSDDYEVIGVGKSLVERARSVIPQVFRGEDNPPFSPLLSLMTDLREGKYDAQVTETIL